jgi:hypothetical protein
VTGAPTQTRARAARVRKRTTTAVMVSQDEWRVPWHVVNMEKYNKPMAAVLGMNKTDFHVIELQSVMACLVLEVCVTSYSLPNIIR